MSDFQINNIGATITGYNNGNGTYTVITQGSQLGSEPTVEVLKAEEVGQRYGKYLDKTPSQDTFQKASNPIEKNICEKDINEIRPKRRKNIEEIEKKPERIVSNDDFKTKTNLSYIV